MPIYVGMVSKVLIPKKGFVH